MPAGEATAWWAEVEDVRARIEARRPTPALHAVGSATAGPRERPRHPAAASARRRAAQSRTPQTPAPPRLVAAPAPLRPLQPRPLPRHRGRLGSNPDRIALWAVMLGLVLLLVSVGSAGAATLGQRTLKAPMEGRDVRRLQTELRRLGLLTAPATAHFGSLTRRAVIRFQRSRCLAADGIAGPATIRAIVAHTPACSPAARGTARAAPVRLRHSRVVTWYGPGMYGRSTACGRRLTSHLIGLAHRTLPCGTRVTLAYGGRVVQATVVDRGPYADGVDYDLTWGAARALGVLGAGRAAVRSNY